MTVSTVTLPEQATGVWSIDAFNSDVSFTVRFLGISNAHGRFDEVAGEIRVRSDTGASTVSATIAAESIDTGFPARDSFIKSGDVLAADVHKQITFVSTGLRADDGGYLLDGDLTIRGVTRPVALAVQPGGFATNPTTGKTVMGLSARTTISRAAFGLGSGVPAAVVSDEVHINLDIQGVLNA